MSLVHKTKKEEGKKHKTKKKTQKKQKTFKINLRNDRFRMLASFKADFGCSDMIQGRFWPISIAGRYDLIRLIRPDFG